MLGFMVEVQELQEFKGQDWTMMKHAEKEENLHVPKAIICYLGHTLESSVELKKIHMLNHVASQMN